MGLIFRCMEAPTSFKPSWTHDLVDQYRLWIFPLVIGSGKRLFSEGAIPSALRLVESEVSTTGVVIGTYEPAGEMVTGTFALE
jgi:dihydrofolate reductase